MWLFVICFILIFLFICVASTPVETSNKTTQIDHMLLLKLERIMKVSLALNCCGIKGGIIEVNGQNNRICFTTKGTNPIFEILSCSSTGNDYLVKQYVPGCPKAAFAAFNSYLNDSTFVNDSHFGCGDDFYIAFFSIPVPPRSAPVYINKLVQLLNAEYPNLRYAHGDSNSLSVSVTPNDKENASYR